jgi:hypothetical protein
MLLADVGDLDTFKVRSKFVERNFYSIDYKFILLGIEYRLQLVLLGGGNYPQIT